MQQWEEKFATIEHKITRLVELNAHYKRVCNELVEAKKSLEAENAALRQQLAERAEHIEQAQSDNHAQESAFQQEKEAIKQRLHQYISDIDSCIQWITTLQ